MTTPGWRRAGPFTAVVVLVLGLGLAPGPARAGSRSPASSPSGRVPATDETGAPGATAPVVELAGQDPWTPIGGEVTLRLVVSNPPPDATVSFTVYQAFSARRTYDETMTNPSLSPGGVLGQISMPLASLPVDASGSRVATLGLIDPTTARDPDRLAVRRPGVYALDVDLRDRDDTTRSRFRTALVVAEAGDRPSVAAPLDVVWVWPITAPPSQLPTGMLDRDVVDDFQPTGRLGRQAAALAAAPEVPVTLAPTGETIAAWSALARDDVGLQVGIDAIRLAATAHQLLSGPYVPVHLPSLLDHGLAPAVDESLTRGAEALRANFGPALDPRTWLLRPASPTALSRLRAAGIDRVVVDAAALAPGPEPRLTPAAPVSLPAPITLTVPGSVTALATDPGLQALLTADLSPARRAQLLLAGLSLVALEAPSVHRVVALVNPDDLDAPAGFFTSMLDGLRTHPYLRPVTAARAFDELSPEATGAPLDERTLATTSAPAPLVGADAYLRQRARLNAFGALTRPGDPAVARADHSLLASVSSAWEPDIARARAAAHLRVVDRVIDRFLARIEVPSRQTITLTSRSGEIPLTFRNQTGYPVRVRAALSSAKLAFPAGAVLELELPPRSTTVRVAVEARTSGTFPLNLEVTSIDGVLPISHRRLEVRSTFVSTVGIALMVSAALFLAVWWGFDLRRRRRRRGTPASS